MKKKVLVVITALLGIGSAVVVGTKVKQEKAKKEQRHVPYGPYEALFKRPLDLILSFFALVFLSPVLLITAILVRVKLGSPVLFTQLRPGLVDPKTGQEKIFRLYKFRTMTDERDENGELLSDEQRLTSFGKKLRTTSVDELPELINIIKGDMSLIGPRPQLVRDMVFMSDKQRMRHTAKPGLSGLAQVKGRNAITWEEKIDWDLKYVEKVGFLSDFIIVLLTIKKVFMRGESDDEVNIALDYGDELLRDGKVTKPKYEALQAYAQNLLSDHEKRKKS